MPTILENSVCDAPLKPVNPPLPPSYRCPETDPGLLWTLTEEEHCKTHPTQKEDTHNVDGRMDRQTDRVLTNCWLQAGRSREPLKGVAFCFLGHVCRDQRSTARRKGRTKIPCFAPTVYRALREM